MAEWKVTDIADALRQQIESKSHAEDLDTEEVLAAANSTSRNTLVRALRHLEVQGLVKGPVRGGRWRTVKRVKRPFMVTPLGLIDMTGVNHAFVSAKKERQAVPAGVARHLDVPTGTELVVCEIVFLEDNAVSGNACIYFAPALSTAIPGLDHDADPSAAVQAAGYEIQPPQDIIDVRFPTPEERRGWDVAEGVAVYELLSTYRATDSQPLYVIVTTLPTDRWILHYDRSSGTGTAVPERRSPRND